jgi:hypothetical protein
MKKVLILLGIIGLFLIGSMSGVKALDSSVDSVSSELVSSETISSSIVSSSEEDTLIESELAKLLDQEIMKYVMYGGSASLGTSLVIGIVWYIFKKWLAYRLAKTDSSTNQIVESNNATQQMVTQLVGSALGLNKEQYNENLELAKNVTVLLNAVKPLLDINKSLIDNISDIKKALEVVLLKDTSVIKSGVGEQVVNTLSKTSTKV